MHTASTSLRRLSDRPTVPVWFSAVLVVFFVTESAAQLPQTIDLSGVGAITAGVRVRGISFEDGAGSSVSGAGDVNGDGISDLLVGAPDLASGAGETYVVFGSTEGLGQNGSFDAATLDGSSGVRILSDNFTGAARSLSGAGDVNGDGYEDIVIGASEAEGPTFDLDGEALLVYGSGDAIGTGGVLRRSELDGANGVRIVPSERGQQFGQSVSGAGDNNGDGFADVVVASEEEAYVILGRASGIGVAGILDLAGATTGVARFSGAEEVAGVSGAGDVDGDGFGDFLVGGRLDGEDVAFLVYGDNTLGIAQTEYDLSQASRVSVISGTDEGDDTGHSVSGVGDVDGDGFDDLLLGAPHYPPRAQALGFRRGAAYLVYGGPERLGGDDRRLSVEFGASDMVVFQGSRKQDEAAYSVSGAGDVDGDGLADLLIGARFADTIASENQAGAAYLVYGSGLPASRTGAIILPSPVEGGSPGIVVLRGSEPADNAGHSVAGAGDINGDSLSDIIVGAPFVDFEPEDFAAGEGYLIYGTTPDPAVFSSWMRAAPAGEKVPANADLARGLRAQPVGTIGDGSHGAPLSRCALAFTGGSDSMDASEPSVQEVALFREPVPTPAVGDWKLAPVHWKLHTTRNSFTESSITLYYAEDEISELDPDRMWVYYASSEEPLSPDTVWIPLVFSHDPERNTVTIHRQHDPMTAFEEFIGYYTILEGTFDYVLGAEIPPPPGADVSRLGESGPEVEPDPQGGALWHRTTQKLYATRAGGLRITWKTSSDQDLVVQGLNVWSGNDASYQLHVADTPPVAINPDPQGPGGRMFALVRLEESEGSTGAAIGPDGFVATGRGRSLVLYSTGPDPREDPIVFQAVRTVAWDDPQYLVDEVPAVIGREIVDTSGFHDPECDTDPDCGGPFVFHETSRYAAVDGYYDRSTRKGPILPVNRDAGDMVVVYYERDTRGSFWPYQAVRYRCEWPEEPDGTIVIASGQGSGPVELDQMAIYRQGDPTKPGYNPNDEHALLLDEQGLPPRVEVSPVELMVLEGASAEVEVVVHSSRAPPRDVVVSVTASRESDPDIAALDAAELVFPVEDWTGSESRTLRFTAADDADSLSGSAVFTLRASGGFTYRTELTAREADTGRLGLAIDRLSFGVPESGSGDIAVRLTREPGVSVTVATSRISGDEDLIVEDGGELTFSRDNWDVAQTITIGALPDGDTFSGEASFRIQASGGLGSREVRVREADASPPGRAVFALRDDLGTPQTSEPYVLLSYRDQDGVGRMKVYKVVAEDETHTFERSLTAGNLIQPPYPLTVLPPCPQSRRQNEGDPGSGDGTHAASGPFWEDRNGSFWARAAGFDELGLPVEEEIVMRFFYPVQQSFDFPESLGDGGPPPGEGDCVPWLDLRAGTPGTPIDVTYVVSWPESVPELRVGETLLEPRFGLPDITGQCSVDVIFEEAGTGMSVQLIDPITMRSVPLEALPDDIDFEIQEGKHVLVDLPLSLRRRVRYDPTLRQLELQGVFDDSGSGDPLLLLNVLSEREKELLEKVSEDPVYREKVDLLHRLSQGQLEGQTSLHSELKALSAGFARRAGYVTLAFQDFEDCRPLPVSLEIIRVTCPLYQGEVEVIAPGCPFEEKLTLRHSGDFAGRVDDFEFEWRMEQSGGSGTPPAPPYEQWTHFLNGQGAQDITIEGPGLLTLSDNWFVCRYRYVGTEEFACVDWSPWTRPQLAEGWIKRVLRGVNPFEQIADDFHETAVDTVVSTISQAGPRWEGDIALSCSPGDSFGLIEAYETVLKRGADLSINAGFDDPASNNALLLAAGRMADLYMLLGNEAYADAQDPTIGFGTEHGEFGSEAPSLHCFMNQTSSLLEEELELLRGRDDTRAPGVEIPPVYNRLYWNFTGDITGGEVAYSLNYNISDENDDGVIDEEDARIMYPQGHGDAWGHYLTAIKSYYRLLRHPSYTWVPRSEAVLVGGVPVTVDFLDERKFAAAAAAKARCGAEIVNLTYRASYVEDPEGQYQGYKDEDAERAWGLSGWASRAGEGSYLDWVVGNALLPSVDESHEGIQKVDRTTVVELREVASRHLDIQAELDKADVGLSPLGLAKNVVPFDISPTGIDAGETHFEQVYDRAVQAMRNAITAFNHANQNSQLLRRQQDTIADFRRTVEEREADFKSRLIEVFGYPYEEDIGEGGTYPEDYDGPDIYHFMYVERSQLLDDTPPAVQEFTVDVVDFGVDDDGNLTRTSLPVRFHLDTNGLGLIKPKDFTRRRAPGELQLARSELLQMRGRFERALREYENLLASVENLAELIEAQHGLNVDEIEVLNATLQTQESLSDVIHEKRERQLFFRRVAGLTTSFAQAVAEGFATNATDFTFGARSVILIGSAMARALIEEEVDRQSLAELSASQAKEGVEARSRIELTTLRQEFDIEQKVRQLEELVRSEAPLRLELFTIQEAMQQAAGRYLAALSRGQRLLEDRLRFRRQTAAQTQQLRYRDMAFRIFRNDALQKYRALFDLAALYVYLAAKAYDYETNLLQGDSRGAGQDFLTDIIRKRTIGQIDSDGPMTGSGLADAMARLLQSWLVLEGQLGFDNPQGEVNRFSLRRELFRTQPGFRGDPIWRETLERHVVENILVLPEFERYCRSFEPHNDVESGIVIPFETCINFAMNFFGWPLGGGDSAYDSTLFTTKIRSVGVWFSNYNNLSGGMSSTPRVYLVPVGADVMRSPNEAMPITREWRVLDQKLPIPFEIGAGDLARDLQDPAVWIPSVDTTPEYGDIRKFSSFRAYHDGGTFNPAETINNSRLIGRSVWNTRWLLIIPAGTLHSDREEGLQRFIHGNLVGEERDGNGVFDILIGFRTYAFSGN